MRFKTYCSALTEALRSSWLQSVGAGPECYQQGLEMKRIGAILVYYFYFKTLLYINI